MGRKISPSRPASTVAVKYAQGVSAVISASSASATASATDETSHTANRRPTSPMRRPVGRCTRPSWEALAMVASDGASCLDGHCTLRTSSQVPGGVFLSDHAAHLQETLYRLRLGQG